LLLAFQSGYLFLADRAGKVPARFPIFALYLFLINAATYVAFWIDKSRARQGGYRISESPLLTLSFLGGSVHCAPTVAPQDPEAALHNTVVCDRGASDWSPPLDCTNGLLMKLA
jgi:Protein of unknown function (DUF1294)